LLTFFNEHHAQHDGGGDVRSDAASDARSDIGIDAGRGGHGVYGERPARAAMVLRECERRGLGAIVTPHGVPLMTLERVHSPRYLHFLRNAWHEWTALDPAHAGRDAIPAVWPVRGQRLDVEPDDFSARLGLYAMDAGTPLTSGTWVAAKTGADCAVNAAHALQRGERGTFALTRPPGHHAGADFFGGACFLNNAALAAQHLLDDGLERVAILDIDHHHGSGTQGIFYHRNDVLVASLHADPRVAFPFYLGHADETGSGAGLGYNMNIPLAPGSTSDAWFAALETACVKIAMTRPQALVVSLGVGAAAPGLARCFGLGGADYLRAGERIAHLGLPTAFIFEGGAAGPELGIHTVNVLEGFETAAD